MVTQVNKSRPNDRKDEHRDELNSQLQHCLILLCLMALARVFSSSSSWAVTAIEASILATAFAKCEGSRDERDDKTMWNEAQAAKQLPPPDATSREQTIDENIADTLKVQSGPSATRPNSAADEDDMKVHCGLAALSLNSSAAEIDPTNEEREAKEPALPDATLNTSQSPRRVAPPAFVNPDDALESFQRACDNAAIQITLPPATSEARPLPKPAPLPDARKIPGAIRREHALVLLARTKHTAGQLAAKTAHAEFMAMWYMSVDKKKAAMWANRSQRGAQILRALGTQQLPPRQIDPEPEKDGVGVCTALTSAAPMTSTNLKRGCSRHGCGRRGCRGGKRNRRHGQREA